MYLRGILAAAAAVALVGYGWLAFHVHTARNAPAAHGHGRLTWVAGPPADALQQQALESLQHGLEALDQVELDPSRTFATYAGSLRDAQSLLTRSLRAQPSQARALARLAAVRWELDPPLTEQEAALTLETVRVASSMAPTAAAVQLKLGEVMLRMGRHDEARSLFARAVELDAATAREIVALVRRNSYSALEAAAVSPRHPAVAAAFFSVFREEGLEADYLELLEGVLREFPSRELTAELLASYGNACERSREPQRLLDRMAYLGTFEDPTLEAERLRQRSRGWLGISRFEQAVEDAREATALAAGAARFVEHEGDVRLAAGDADAAIGTYRKALAQVAQLYGDVRWRARLYRKIGQAEERRGAAPRAYDPYRMALRLDPNEPVARKRIQAMEQAAGLRSPDP